MNAARTFGTNLSYPQDLSMSQSATGDFNGDGRTDLALAMDFPAAAVDIALGQGDGTFTDLGFMGPSGIGTNPTALIVADFDADGVSDIATVGKLSDSVRLLRGSGDGTFVTGAIYPVGDFPLALVAADFNGDGKLDIANSDNRDDSVHVLLGAGDGTFTVSGPIAVDPDPGAIVAADFSGDGKIDLAVASSNTTTIEVLLGSGDGTFVRNGLYGTVYGPTDMALGDFDLDGRPDLAVVPSYGGDERNISIVLNTAPSPWTKVGHALAGSNGVPSLHGSGTLAAGSHDAFHLIGARPAAAAGLFFGLTQVLAPFKGGTLVPAPLLILPLFTGPTGLVDLAFVMPAVPPGLALVTQVWIADPQAAHGFAASNGLVGVTP
jgi:hypothetical protein